MPAVFQEASEKSSGKDVSRKFIYRTLGKTGLRLPIVSMGTGDTMNPSLIKAALDQGIVLLATSQYYGNGNNEKIVGELVKGRPKDSYILMTSAGPADVDYEKGTFGPGNKTDEYLKMFDGSLKRLQVETIDICLLPFAGRRESVFFEPLLRAMETLKKQGKAKYIGIATHSYEPEAIRAAVDTGIYDVVMTAINFRKDNIAELRPAIAHAAGAGLGIIAMKTMAGGYWDKARTRPVNTKASLKWVLQDENVHTAVPGFTSFEEMLQDLSVMENLALTDQEKADLQLASVKDPTGIYCQQCGVCIPQCINELDIPTLMRSYMYAYGYRNLSHAQETLLRTGINNDPCSGCTDCLVNCTSNFDVKRKIQDIVRLKEIPQEFIS
jgi:predicted aldo/keto reductase-like oxidoreductase